MGEVIATEAEARNIARDFKFIAALFLDEGRT